MNKIILAVMCLLVGNIYAQIGRVGVNTESPQATLHIGEVSEVETNYTQGVIFPRLSTNERAQFVDVAYGTMIYNTTLQCLEVFKGKDTGGDNGWHCECGANNFSLKRRVETLGSFYEYTQGGVCRSNTIDSITLYNGNEEDSGIMIAVPTHLYPSSKREDYSVRLIYDFDNQTIEIPIEVNYEDQVYNKLFNVRIKEGSYVFPTTEEERLSNFKLEFTYPDGQVRNYINTTSRYGCYIP